MDRMQFDQPKRREFITLLVGVAAVIFAAATNTPLRPPSPRWKIERLPPTPTFEQHECCIKDAENLSSRREQTALD
jgi:hypothetical protein